MGEFERLIGAKSRPGLGARLAHTWTWEENHGGEEGQGEGGELAAYGVLCGAADYRYRVIYCSLFAKRDAGLSVS